MSFSHLGLSEKVLAAVAATGYKTPTPIQDQAIPHVLARRDVFGIAQTGTGKTAAFVLPMLTMLENGRARARMPRTLILEPTRELAAQVEESFIKYGANHNKLNVALIIGGVSFDDQDTKLMRGVDVLIATPGRLLDHNERGRLLLSGVELLVIDEADRMLDMGFIPDIERICKLVPFTRQTLFFTATMPPEIRRITEQFLSNPVRVEVSRPATTVATTTQLLASSGRDGAEKRDTLRRLIRSAEGMKNAIIFCNRKRDVATLHRSLLRHGFSVQALHGDMDQSARTAALEQFRKNEVTLLVASDVAARGLDIPDVSHIYQFRRADPCRRLRAPHRPHRPRRPRRHRHHHRRRIERRQGRRRDRKADRPADPLHGQDRRHACRATARAKKRAKNEPRHEPRQTARPPQRGRHEHQRRSQQPERRPPSQQQQPAPVARIEDARPRRAPQPVRKPMDDGDASHLPAFLLRPVPLKA